MSRTAEKFGEVLRKLRVDRDISLGALARHLGTSVVYVSGVELGKTGPLTVSNILKAADLFGIDPKPLLEAAAAHRGGAVQVPLPTRSPVAQEVLTSMLRAAPDFDDKAFLEFVMNAQKRHGSLEMANRHRWRRA